MVGERQMNERHFNMDLFSLLPPMGSINYLDIHKSASLIYAMTKIVI